MGTISFPTFLKAVGTSQVSCCSLHLHQVLSREDRAAGIRRVVDEQAAGVLILNATCESFSRGAVEKKPASCTQVVCMAATQFAL